MTAPPNDSKSSSDSPRRLSNTTELQRYGIENPRQLAWVLFDIEGNAELTDKQVLGIFLFDFLQQMGFADPRIQFIVKKTLDWAYEEIGAERPAIIQLLDQRFLVYFGLPTDGYHAWDFVDMKEAEHKNMPDTPLISLAISVTRLYEERVSPIAACEPPQGTSQPNQS